MTARCFLLCLCISVASASELPRALIEIPDSVGTILIAATDEHRLYHYNRTSAGFVARAPVYMSIGEYGAGKERDGDRRTPLGIYFVTERLDTSRMHEKYGPMAFVLDYPNRLDALAGRTGDGIWLHGVDARNGQRRPPLDTDGCLALQNDDLELLDDRVVPNTTPVIIGQTIRWAPQTEVEQLRTELNAAMNEWAASLERGDLHAFLSLYSEQFLHWGMNKPEWTVLVLETLAKRPISAVRVDDLLLLRDPARENLFLSRFKLAITERGGTIVSTKRLYWQRADDGALQIIAEDAG